MQKNNSTQDPVTETIHGLHITDNFRWLENGRDPAVQDWVKEQNVATEQALKGDSFNFFSQELTKNFKAVTFSLPHLRNNHYFYTERQPDEDHSVLYVKNPLQGESRVLINPNTLSPAKTTSLDDWCVSKRATFLAYGLSEKGDEMSTIYVLRVATGEKMTDVIPRCRYFRAVWAPDESGFFYTRNPEKGAVPENEENLHTKLYFHKLGDDYRNDELIFGKDRPKDDMIGMTVSVDGRYLSISVASTWTKNDLYLYDTQSKTTVPLAVGLEGKFSLRFLQDRVIVVTNYKAPYSRVLSAPLDNFIKPIERWDELIPEGKSPIVSVSATASKLIVEYLVHVCSQVQIYNYEGVFQGELGVPPLSTLVGVATHREEEEFFYGVTSFTFPQRVYHFDPGKNAYNLYREIKNPINPEEYAVAQEWCVSKDGTKVPFFIFHKKGVVKNGGNPTLLYGYGGFSHSETPGFVRNWVPWIEQGGICVVANIRGGGEFGKEWHAAGVKERKQNSFDDFIAVAEHVISEKYTSPKHLAILGGSNGGLLVAAVMVQRPELFAAVCSRVPLTDMVRFSQFGMAVRWTHEYGDPQNADDLKRILTWSPYHNVREGVTYPPILFTTGENDSRVDPLHARKIVALLQSFGNENTFLFVELDAGHGMGKPIYKIIESQALMLTFFAKHTGMRVVI